MEISTRVSGCAVLAVAAASCALPLIGYCAGREDPFAGERTRVESLCRTAQPEVAEISGFDVGEPVPVRLIGRAELRRFLSDTVEREYPAGELENRQRCFAEIGVVGREVDLKAALVALVESQAGGLYDPFDKVFLAIADLEPEQRGDTTQRLIVGHELIHALQDRELDLAGSYRRLLSDLDVGFAFAAVVEGSAMVGGLAHAQGVPVESLGNVAAMLRASFDSYNASMPAFAEAPTYVREILLSPYVEGARFVQWYLRQHPEDSMADIFDDLPVSSEQVMHPGKAAAGDVPIRFDLVAAAELAPSSWHLVYTNTLGELELRTLFLNQGRSRGEAAGLAEGWDGGRIFAFATETDETVTVGITAWDSAAEAERSEEAFAPVLNALHGSSGFAIERSQQRVAFVTGLGESNLRASLIAAAISAPAR